MTSLVASTATSLLLTTTLLAGLALVFLLAGQRWVAALDEPGLAGLSLALGMGSAATALLLLGWVGGLRPLPVALGVLTLAGLERRALRGWARAGWRSLRARPGAWALVGGLALPVLLLAAYPPTEYDALTYHLPYARAFASLGEVGWLPQLRFPVFPQLQELIFAAILPLRETGPQVVQLLATAATAALLQAWGRGLGSPRLGLWAAAAWLGNPLVLWMGTAAYVDAGLTLQVTAACFAWERWHTTRAPAWLAAAAAAAGFAAATKYLGLFFVAGLAIMTGGATRGWRATARWLTIAGLAAGLWYGRILYYTGNPVFPFYGAWFGFSEWAPELARTPGLSATAGSLPWTERLTGWGADLVFLALTPWRAAFDRGVFGFQAPLAPWILLGLPLAPTLLGSAWGRRWGLLGMAYGLFWLTTVRDVRFLLPVLPLATVLLVRAADQVPGPGRDLRPRSVALVALLLLAPGPAYAAFKVYERGPPPTGTAARHAYLAAEVAGYDAMRWLADRPGPPAAVYGVFAESLHYYAPGRYLGAHLGPVRYAYAIEAARGGGRRLHRYLQELGVDYLLSPDARPGWRPPDDPAFGRCFVPAFQGSDTTLFALSPATCRSEPTPR